MRIYAYAMDNAIEIPEPSLPATREARVQEAEAAFFRKAVGGVKRSVQRIYNCDGDLLRTTTKAETVEPDTSALLEYLRLEAPEKYVRRDDGVGTIEDFIQVIRGERRAARQIAEIEGPVADAVEDAAEEKRIAKPRGVAKRVAKPRGKIAAVE